MWHRMNHQLLLLRAKRASQNLHKSEAVAFLRIYEVDEHQAFRSLQCTSLTNFLEGVLQLSPSMAHTLVVVIRKSRQVPDLKNAIVSKRITLSQAKTIAPAITPQNAPKWISLCTSHTIRELERQVARHLPDAPPVERVRFRAKDQVIVTVTLRDAGFRYFERAQQLLKQSTQAQITLAETIERVFEEYTDREDPVLKAERKTPDKRSEREKVFVRDQGACQFKLSNSQKCGQRYWIDVHHVVPRALGGHDVAENMITYCSEHHRMEHGQGPAT